MSKMRFFALQELANRRPVKVDYPSEKLADYYGHFTIDRGTFLDCVYYCFISLTRQIFLHFFTVEYVVAVIIS